MPESPSKLSPPGGITADYPLARWRLLVLMLPTLILMLPYPAAATTAPASPDQLFRDLLQRELNPSPELPRLQIDQARIREKEGRVELSFNLQRETAEPSAAPDSVEFTESTESAESAELTASPESTDSAEAAELPELLVPLLISTPEQSFTTTLTSRAQTTPVRLLLPERPTEIRLDPYQETARRLAPAEIPPTWAGFLAAANPLAITPENPPASWQPLFELLAQKGVARKTLAQVRDQELAAASLLFIASPDQDPARGFFAEKRLPAGIIDLAAYPNPLNPQYPALRLRLDQDDGPEPTLPTANRQTLLTLLDSPGLFSRLRIEDGMVKEQTLAGAEKGVRLVLDTPPDGIAVASRLSLPAIMAQLAETRVIHVGEVHTRYEDHLLQLRVLRAMHRQNPKVAVGMEMFPASAQPVLDAYVAGEIDEPEFLRQTDYFTNWSFDYRLYREIIDFARHHRLPIVALNLEKGITGKVFRAGFAELSPEEVALIPSDRDLNLPGYRQRIDSAFRMHDQAHGRGNEGFSGFLQAQSLWDEQMAARMAEFLRANPDYRILGVVGQGHGDKRNAIPPRLARRLPVSQAVIMPAREQIGDPEAADYFIFNQPQSLPEPALLGVRIRDGETTEPGEPGALVTGLSPHGKAKQAGIEESDLLIGLDEWQIANTNDLRIALLYRQPGDRVQIRLRRPLAEAEPEPTSAAETGPETQPATTDQAAERQLDRPIELTLEVQL